MAGFPLGIHRLLLPWKSAGVDYLLCSAEVLAALRASRPSGNASGSAAGNVAGPQVSRAPGPAAPAQRASGPIPVRPAAPAPSAGAGSASAQAAQVRRVSSAAISPPSVPADWLALRARKTPPHPRLVWTYPELAEDMSGRGSAERSRLWQRLIADLGLPRGSNAFWPLAPLTGQPSSPARCDPAFFFFGISDMRPQTVLFFCSALPGALNLPPLSFFQPVIVNGVQYVLLHEPARIAEDLRTSSSRYQRLVSFLKSLSG